MAPLITVHGRIDARTARVIGRAAALYGYPLVEMLRLCRLQTRPHHAQDARSGPAMNTLRRWDGGPGRTHAFVSGWIQLADGPYRLRWPAGAHPPARRMLLAIYDAASEPFLRVDLASADISTGGWLLLGPHAAPPPSDGSTVLRCPSDMLWLIGRIDDGGQARDSLQLATQVCLDRIAADDSPVRRPAAVDLWRGPPVDMLSAIGWRNEHARTIAADFFANLCHGLAHAPRQLEDHLLLQRMHDAGLGPCVDDFGDWPASRRHALAEGLADAALLIRRWQREPQQCMRLPETSPLLFTRRHALRAVAASCGIGTRDDEPFQGTGGLDMPLHPPAPDARHALMAAA